MQKIVISLALFLALNNKCIAQFSRYIDSLNKICNNISSDSGKVIALGQLANYYNIFYLNAEADSVLERQLLIAETSNNPNLIITALFGDALENVSATSTSETFDNTVRFIQKGIDYARMNNRYNYLALGYNRMAALLCARGNHDKALNNSLLALSVLENVSSDSVKSEIYITLADIYHAKGEEVSACTNYNNAFDIALQINSVYLQSKIYHRLAEVYRSLENTDLAKAELQKSLALNRKYGNSSGMVVDYFDLSRITDEKYFIEEAVRIADSLRLYKYLISAKRFLFAYTYVVEKNRHQALQYLKEETDLKQSFLNSGIEKYYQAVGNVYLYSGMADSALYYYHLALPAFENKFDSTMKKDLYSLIAQSHALLKDYPLAITFYQKALKISQQSNDRSGILIFSEQLSNLYEKQNDFHKALYYSKQAVAFKDIIRDFSKEKDITLLMVDRENRRHEQELLYQKRRDNLRMNLQFMAITIALVVVFFMILFIGSYQVSRTTVKIMGFFFFISLFEFLVLLIDEFFVKEAVPHEPLKIWLFKIALIGSLAPLQHYLERNLIGLLASKKLVHVRSEFSIKRWFKNLSNSLSK